MALSEVAREHINGFEGHFRASPYDLVTAIPLESLKKWEPTHITTIKLRRKHVLPSHAARDPIFRVSLRTTLIKFSVHRPKGFVDFKTFDRQVGQAAEVLDALNEMRIERVPVNDLDYITNKTLAVHRQPNDH